MPIKSFIVAAAFSVTLPTVAFADCTSNAPSNGVLNLTQVQGLLVGRAACVGSAGNWHNQELHTAGGRITDYKKGPADARDPTIDIGSYTISSDATGGRITYNYTGGGSFTYYILGVSSATPPRVPANFFFCKIVGVGQPFVAVRIETTANCT